MIRLTVRGRHSRNDDQVFTLLQSFIAPSDTRAIAPHIRAIPPMLRGAKVKQAQVWKDVRPL